MSALMWPNALCHHLWSTNLTFEKTYMESRSLPKKFNLARVGAHEATPPWVILGYIILNKVTRVPAKDPPKIITY